MPPLSGEVARSAGEVKPPLSGELECLENLPLGRFSVEGLAGRANAKRREVKPPLSGEVPPQGAEGFSRLPSYRDQQNRDRKNQKAFFVPKQIILFLAYFSPFLLRKRLHKLHM